jgi:hypothetical protein
MGFSAILQGLPKVCNLCSRFARAALQNVAAGEGILQRAGLPGERQMPRPHRLQSTAEQAANLDSEISGWFKKKV